ncbi:NERD domain-containing protein [Frankia sp. CNm7]|uniref:NERD domain-containing protein n=1 Tax=Frankia nepalensis TaxID=1836974 RepID=A0A937UPY8_9ACTN|nr:nuclease-related domain-containing protein [Frankia nepalensis]MBL7495152.1 NERD domain-containing protein [Frankia nepalensis]MBL7509883.1 NERD domain-containing protein [Frankia nepalensis]MBL7520679.1 NERD domain-containing protein [Frankia nepalensis]MBL7629642.1 NERD domain-containing protein [Frankia nepalensis]
MATITRPAMKRKTGRPGQYLQSEYRRAREHQALVRRDRLARVLPRSLAKSVPVALLICLVLAFGVSLPGGYAVLVFVLIVGGWSGVIVLSSFGADKEVESLRVSAEAEHKTARAVARLRHRGWVVMHDMLVANADATVGHLLVGPGGVLVLNSEPARGVVRYTKKVASVDGEPLTAAIERAKFLADQIRLDLRAAVPLIKIPVSPVLVMTEADVLWNDGAVDGVTIISIRQLVDWARSRQRRLNPVEVKQVTTTARTLFPAFVDNRSLDQVTMGRDQWLMLMDTLHTIREREGDASGLLDRLATIETQLSRQADGFTRSGLVDGLDDTESLDELSDEFDDEDLVAPAPRSVDVSATDGTTGDDADDGGPVPSLHPLGRTRGRRTRGGGRPSLASVRPERETPPPGASGGSPGAARNDAASRNDKDQAGPGS